MNAIELLKQDHQRLLTIMNELEVTTEEEKDKRNELFQAFKEVFDAHDRSEDEIFYPALEKYPSLKKLTLKGYQAHHVVEVAILELRLLPYTAESWGPKFSVNRDAIISHMNEEEEVLFPMVTKYLSATDLDELGNDILNMRE